MTEKNATQQTDGAYLNAVTGIGSEISKSTHNMVDLHGRPFLSVAELTRIYEKDGVAAKIVNCINDDAMGAGFEIVGDTDGRVQAAMEKSGFSKAVRKAGRYSRLYGGAVMIMRMADGRKLEEEPGNGEIVGFDVFSAARVQLDASDFDNDKESPGFGRLLRFRVDVGDGVVTVSAARCVFFEGDMIPDGDTVADRKTRFFGNSVLNPMEGKLAALGISFNAIEDALQEFKVAGYKLSDLQLMLSRPDGGEKAIQNRFAAINLGKSMCRAVVLDKDDEYFTQETGFGGIPEVILKVMQIISASADIPMARLYGESASGLAATGEGDRAMYDQKVDSWREGTLKGPMETAVREFTSRASGLPKLAEVSFNPVSKPKQADYVNMCKTQAETLKAYFEMGVLTGDEIRRMVFEGGHTFNMDIK